MALVYDYLLQYTVGISLPNGESYQDFLLCKLMSASNAPNYDEFGLIVCQVLFALPAQHDCYYFSLFV